MTKKAKAKKTAAKKTGLVETHTITGAEVAAALEPTDAEIDAMVGGLVGEDLDAVGVASLGGDERVQYRRVAADSLRLDPANVRLHPQRNMDAIKGSIARFGQVEPIVVQRGTNIIIGGNARYQVLRDLGAHEVDIVELDIDDLQAAALGIALNRTAELAEWDFGALNRTLAEIVGQDHALAIDTGFDEAELEKMLASLGTGGVPPPELDETYTKKIQAPIYEIKGERPAVAELADMAKTESLLDEIAKADVLTDDVRAFLVAAAWRHSVFNYEKIAEFYAHASEKIQDLMERSALVIIDFDKAIECGFVKLSDAIAEAYRDE